MMTRLLLCAALVACTDTYHYEPVSAGKPEGEQVALRAKTSSQFLRGTYADLVGRTPQTYEIVIQLLGTEFLRFTLDEETMLAASLDGVGDSLPMRNLIAKGLLHSTEVAIPARAAIADPRAYIRDQFRRFLGRDPNPYELEQFAGERAKDAAVGPRTIIRAIVGSREYQSQ